MTKTLVIPVALLLALPACQSPTGVDKAEAAARTMRETKDALADAPDKITAVSASLDELAKEGGDMAAEFKTFSGNVDSLVSHRERLRSLRKQVEDSRAQFTGDWEKKMQEIKSEELRKRAEERRAGVVAKFGELSKVADSGREEFEPWLQTVLDVRAYLENDLNPTGVASVKDEVKKVKAGATSVNKKINTIVSGLEDMGKAIAAAKPPVEETKPGEASTEKKK